MLTVCLLLSSALVHCFLVHLILQSVPFQMLHNKWYIINEKAPKFIQHITEKVEIPTVKMSKSQRENDVEN